MVTSSAGHDHLVEHAMLPLLLQRGEHKRVKSILSLSDVRRLFDQVIKEYLILQPRLAATVPIINYTKLKHGKSQRSEALTIAERTMCSNLRSTLFEWTPANRDSGSSIIKAAFKERKSGKRSHYVDVANVPLTSNECDRFFSMNKFVLTDRQKNLLLVS
ncbi:Hypothetical protein PHPALM_12384 [Phytophthora palmivora]|uniref:HAT C-terminal dimerisation domain-containing protein n=1 Tax=Phytophthora palmivora TaxID=4796 RepID=A0A2P4XZW7_9STRA|nr:Hypothetical protein PHPALM_12384 [Phytophthora palmivora]